MASEPKRRKIESETSRRATSIPSESKDKPTVSGAAQTSSAASDKIKQAKNLAVAQAQQEGSKGNFRIFDSPFGNFLVPVIPTRAELDASNMSNLGPNSKNKG
ncbi:PREDICTED: uncharacterized protein LOC109186307 isoform X2 [Ipomoea nil]|uniref:uncharacterized protein LOC109186307 isoform X2 n=1 Tax=Ipomoea nil TaxID=35883 RepID=UPI000900923A|nr:PREDICTED: uncharacterized protein LOC109186307 isoform X2 [Ipomoea nil]